MTAELIPITCHKVMQTKAYTAIVLGTQEKQFAIYTSPHVGHHIQLHLTQRQKSRPLTHDLITALLRGLNLQLLQVVIHHVEDTVYFARLFLQQQVGDERHVLEIDARPSDCITLALMCHTPLFCKKEVLDKVVAINI